MQDDRQEAPRRDGAVTRRLMLGGTAALGLADARPATAQGTPRPAAPGRGMLVYVGSYTAQAVPGGAGNGEGITLFRLDPATGTLAPVKLAARLASPSWLALHPNRRTLYAISEISDFQGGNGSVSAFSVDARSGDLTPLNTVSSGGAGPAHCSVHPSGKYVLVANYGAGSVAVLPVRENGALGEATDVQADPGEHGPDHSPAQPPGSHAHADHDKAHAHMIAADPSARFVLVNDLGLDRTFVWKLDLSSGKLSPADPPFLAAPPGSGPRHFAFHPNGRVLYNFHEQDATITVHDYDPATAHVTPRQTISGLPPGFAGTSTGSELLVSHDGRFAYAGNRGHNSVGILAAGTDGRLKWVDSEWVRGDWLRTLALDPGGRVLLSLNQRGDAITVFRVDRATGRLAFTGHTTPIGSPAGIAFLA